MVRNKKRFHHQASPSPAPTASGGGDARVVEDGLGKHLGSAPGGLLNGRSEGVGGAKAGAMVVRDFGRKWALMARRSTISVPRAPRLRRGPLAANGAGPPPWGAQDGRRTRARASPDRRSTQLRRGVETPRTSQRRIARRSGAAGRCSLPSAARRPDLVGRPLKRQHTRWPRQACSPTRLRGCAAKMHDARGRLQARRLLRASGLEAFQHM